MKKKVKALVIAASVAAIAGIGAVSFAAWSNGNVATEAGTSLTTGTVSINAGFVVASSGAKKTLSFETGKVLVPVDQGGTLGANDVKMLSAALGDIQVVKGTYNFKLDVESGKSSDLKLYYQVATTATEPSGLTAESGTTVNDKEDSITTQLTGWTAIGTATSDVTVNLDAETVNDLNLYVILVSSDLADMGESVDLTLTFTSTPQA